MKNKLNDPILEIFLQQMHQKLGSHLKQIILFGSRARGDFDRDSDYDCLAVVDEVSPKVDETIAEIMGQFLNEHDMVFSIFPITQEMYQQDVWEPLLINVRKEGVVL
ncbi:MAG: nucleotidyltransferase domain-containing protein [Anaerolineales bacterium]|nr:nucleotidyltransferase domain-containing protein [Anaerolineales bacterium]